MARVGLRVANRRPSLDLLPPSFDTGGFIAHKLLKMDDAIPRPVE
jgi:hypothetical protein